MRLPELIAALSQRDAFPDDAGSAPVKVIQTHASVVFLAGDRAWKIKKPVDLGFLDFTSLASRQKDCEEEVRLNRRMVPDLYHGVWPVVRANGGDSLRVIRERSAELDRQAVEWVVEMSRLPAEGMVDVLIAENRLTADDLERFADDLALFHRRADDGPEVAASGEIDRLEQRIRDNVTHLESAVGKATEREGALLPSDFVPRLRRLTLAWLRRLAPTLERRRQEGRVRDGHGDLHARNLCRVDGRIRAYDCLEFNRRFRCADVAMEVAFLSMDLDRLGRHDLAEHFVASYVRSSGDTELPRPSLFFRLHYAIVRSMVEAIRLAATETPAAERPAIRSSLRSYAALAAGYLVEPATVLMMGLPATGKSVLARALAHSLRANVLRSDEIRKRLAGVEPNQHAGSSAYSEAATRRTYEEMSRQAQDVGASVILDAAHLTTAERAISIRAAKARGAVWLLAERTAEDAELAKRLAQRAVEPDNVSDATIDVVGMLRERREDASEISADRRLSFSATQGIEEASFDVVASLLRLADAASSGA
jgi:aminoglycoside phosphotransferase family enzyme/predicted kinase